MGLMNLFNLARVRPHVGYRFQCEIWPYTEGSNYNEKNIFGQHLEFGIKKITQPVYNLNTENKQYFGNTAYVVPIFKFGETNMEITFEETDDMTIYQYLSSFINTDLYDGFQSCLINVTITQFNESMVEIVDKRNYICRLKDLSMPSFNNTSLGSPIEITALFKVFYVSDEPFDNTNLESKTMINNTDEPDTPDMPENSDKSQDSAETPNDNNGNNLPKPSGPLPPTDPLLGGSAGTDFNVDFTTPPSPASNDNQPSSGSLPPGYGVLRDSPPVETTGNDPNTPLTGIALLAREPEQAVSNTDETQQPVTGVPIPYNVEQGITFTYPAETGETGETELAIPGNGQLLQVIDWPPASSGESNQPVLGVTNEGKTAAELIDEETAAVLAEFDEAGIRQPEPAKTFAEEEKAELARIMEEDGDLNLLGEQNREESVMKPQDIPAPEKQPPSNPTKRTGIYTGDDEFFVAIANSYEIEISKKEGRFGQYFFDMNDAGSSAGTGNAGSGSSIGQRGGAYDKMGKIKVTVNGEELEFDNMTKFDAAMQTAFGGRQIIIDTLKARGGGTGGYNPNADLAGAKSDLRAILDEPGKGVITDRNGKTAELSFDESNPYLYLNATFSEDITRQIAETDMKTDSNGWSDQIKSTVINDYKMTGGAPNKVVQGMLHMGHVGGSMGTVWRNFNKDENNIKLLQRDINRGYFSEETLQALRNSVKFEKEAHNKMYIGFINKYGYTK